MLLIDVPLSVTLAPNAGFTAGGRLICTNASPPEIKSARLESTTMSGPTATADAGGAQASIPVGNSHRAIAFALRFIESSLSRSFDASSRRRFGDASVERGMK